MPSDESNDDIQQAQLSSQATFGIVAFALALVFVLCCGLCITKKYCFPLCTLCRNVDLNAKDEPKGSTIKSLKSTKAFDSFPKKVLTKTNVNDIVLQCPNLASPGSEMQMTSPMTGRFLRVVIPENITQGMYFIYSEKMSEAEKVVILDRENEAAKMVRYDLPLHGCCTYESTARADQWTKCCCQYSDPKSARSLSGNHVYLKKLLEDQVKAKKADCGNSSLDQLEKGDNQSNITIISIPLPMSIERGEIKEEEHEKIAPIFEILESRLATDAFDCIRGFGSLQVFVGHFFTFFGQPYLRADGKKSSVDFGGANAVLMFFIMSGFLMMTGYSNKHPFKWPEAKLFYKARFARMVPVAWLSILVTIPLSIARQSYNSQTNRLTDAYIAISYVLDLSFLQSWILMTDINTPLWSTSAQMFCYSCFPYMVIHYHTVRNRFRFLCDVTLQWLIYLILWTLTFMVSLDYLVAHFNPLNKLPLFIMGCIFASNALCNQRVIKSEDYIRKWNNYCNWITAVIVLFFFMQVITSFSCTYVVPVANRFIGELFFPLIYGFWLYSFTQAKNSFAYRLFCWKPFRFLGEISFSFYALHWPILDYYNYFRNGKDYLNCGWTSDVHGKNCVLVAQWEIIPVFFIIGALSTLCTFYFENPMRDFLTLKLIGQHRVKREQKVGDEHASQKANGLQFSKYRVLPLSDEPVIVSTKVGDISIISSTGPSTPDGDISSSPPK